MRRRFAAAFIALASLLSLDSAPTAMAASPVRIESGEDRLAELIRQEHLRACGHSLVRASQHNRLDRWRADDMLTKGYFSHSIPAGGHYWDYFRRYGIEDWVAPYASEILATNTGYSSDTAGGTAAYKGFMDSSAHRAAIRNCSYNAFGVGAYRVGSHRVFAVTFSKQPTERAEKTLTAREGPGTSYDIAGTVDDGTRQLVFKHRNDSTGRRWDQGWISGFGSGWLLDALTD